MLFQTLGWLSITDNEQELKQPEKRKAGEEFVDSIQR